MLTNTRLDSFGQILALMAILALARCIWIDVRVTNVVSRIIPGVTSRDRRKWRYIRENFAQEVFWRAEVETILLMTFISAVFALIGFHYGDGEQHDRTFGWLSLGGGVWCLLMLAKDAWRRRQILSKF